VADAQTGELRTQHASNVRRALKRWRRENALASTLPLPGKKFDGKQFRFRLGQFSLCGAVRRRPMTGHFGRRSRAEENMGSAQAVHTRVIHS